VVHPHLRYWIHIFSGTSQVNLNIILLLPKKAIRIISKEAINTHTHNSPLFKNLGILPFDKLVLQAKLNFMHSIEFSYAPSMFTHSFIKNNNRNIDLDLININDYQIPFARTESIKKNTPLLFFKGME
jgi:hypothetical protein